jgi:ABC-type Fe3+-siderophore transport system permease subunit
VELIESESEPQGPLPEPEPRYQTAALPIDKSEHGQAWLRLLAAILIGLVLVVLIVLLARWIYHKSHHAVQPVPATSQKSGAQSNLKVTPGGQTQTSNNPSSSSPSNPSTPSSSASSGSTQITNTGPGNVVAVFVGTSLAAAGLHFIISTRRANKLT